MPRWQAFEPYFWSLVETSPMCWLWLGSLDGNGYGRIHHHGRRQGAHRVMWQLVCGDIPVGLFVLHSCDVQKCVRPDHLFLGTQKDNMQDWTRKGKNKLINDPIRGDQHWTRTERGAKWRREFGNSVKDALRSGRRVSLRWPDGTIRGTRCVYL